MYSTVLYRVASLDRSCDACVGVVTVWTLIVPRHTRYDTCLTLCFDVFSFVSAPTMSIRLMIASIQPHRFNGLRPPFCPSPVVVFAELLLTPIR